MAEPIVGSKCPPSSSQSSDANTNCISYSFQRDFLQLCMSLPACFLRIARVESSVYFFFPPAAAPAFAAKTVSLGPCQQLVELLPAGGVLFFLGLLFPRCFNLESLC